MVGNLLPTKWNADDLQVDPKMYQSRFILLSCPVAAYNDMIVNHILIEKQQMQNGISITT